MSQLSSHQALVDKSFTINKGTVQAGMLLEFVYTKVARNGKQSTKKYMVLATSDFVKRSQDNVKMMHGVTCEIISKSALLGLAKITGLELANSRLKARRLKIEKVLIADQKSYYSSVISSGLRNILKGSYRTFREDRISGLKICDYKWPKELLLEDEKNTSIKTQPTDPDIPKLDQ